MLSVIAYLGVLVAPTVTFSIPFQVLWAAKIQPPSILYWFSATAILLLALWLLYRLGSAGYHGFRSGVINLEAIFGFVGVMLTVAFIVWFLPTGWARTHPNKPNAADHAMTLPLRGGHDDAVVGPRRYGVSIWSFIR